ncbi:uncharacterized protein LOC126816929 isoform X2 [Patella vulgata]|uniref:uncharacterized protein LOC126816929 isoform X2 n=1 Tax=Patella vulgata TaxID=6465 RepID=UPI00217FC47B|nr:uncharacterized protein LOC126816929 isoform X2 [Patella vulgata]
MFEGPRIFRIGSETYRHSTSVNTIPQIETRPTPSTSSSTDTVSALGLQTVTQPSPSTSSSTYTGSALVSQTETLHGNTSTEIRVSIIGKTGVGKSALGNALLQHNIFKSQQQINSVTSECGSGQRHLQLNGVDTLLKVVDTPGLFDMGNSNKTIAKEIVKCINILSPGPHLFIMVFRIDYRLSQEDIKVLEYFKNTFGEMIDKFAVVVFTGKDQLDDRSEEDAMREHHAQLSTYSDVFKNRRFATINNKDKTEGKKKDVDRILQLLQTTIENNGGDFYKNEMYEEAKKLFETRIQDQEEDNEKALAELDKLKKERIEMAQQLGHFKQQEEEHKRREKDVSNRELELKRREDLIQRLSLPSGQSYTEQASTSAYQHVEYQESPPDAKRRKVIARREKGKMSPEDDWRIISNYMYLTENLNPLHQLLDSLIQMYVLNEDDLEKIRRAESSAGTKAMIRQFLDILRTCGRHAYPKFIICLIKSGYGEVAEQLTSDVDMDGIVKREEKQLRTEKKYLQLQKKLQQIKQESEQAIHISAKENRRIKTTLNSWRIALKTKTNILVRFKSEMRTKTKLLDQLKEERDTRNEDLQMTKVRNSILYDELDRIYEQNVIIEGIKEEFVDDDNGQDVEINKSDYSSVDIQARDGKLLVKQEPLDVHQAEDVNETDDIDRSLPTDDTPVDGITKDKVVENTGLFVKQEPQDVNETCDVTQPTDLWSTTRPDIDQTHEVSQPAGDQQGISAYQHVQYQEGPYYSKRRKFTARREKGKMLPEDERKIISNYGYLTKNLNPLHPLLDSLIEMYVLNEDDLEQIRRAESKGGRKTMIRQFLDILRTCGINAYPKLICCLKISGYGTVAEQLESDTVILHHTDQRYGEMSGSSQGNQFMIREMADRRHYDVSHSGVGNRSEIHTDEVDVVKVKIKKAHSPVILSKVKPGYRNVQIKEETLSTCRRNAKNIANCVLYENQKSVFNHELEDEHEQEDYVNTTELNTNPKSQAILGAVIQTTDDSPRDVTVDMIDDQKAGKDGSGSPLVIKQEPQDLDDQQDITTLLTPGHHSPNRDSCLQSTSQHQDTESGQPSTSSSLDSSHINQRKDDTTPVKTSPVYDDDKVVRPVDKYTLFNVCEHDTLDKLKSILSDKTIDINNTCDLGRTAMFYCIKSDIQPIEKLELLISYGAKLDVKDKDGNSILHVACEYGCVETVKLLLNTGRVDIESMDNDDETPILLAMRSRHQPVEKLELLISYGAKLDVKYTFGDSLLHAACMIGCVETVKRLLNTGRVDIESMNHFKETPIFNAIFSFEKPIEKVELLISYGAKLDVKDGDSNRLLHEACEYGCVEIVEWLLNTGKVDIESKGNDDETPIIWALCSTKQSIQKVKLLLDKGAQLDHSSSILHYACQYGSLDCVKYFINTKEFDIESRNDKNQTPLFDCVLTKRNNFKKKIELLMSMNVNKLVRDINNLSVLQFARQHVKKPRVQYLIKNGFTD